MDLLFSILLTIVIFGVGGLIVYVLVSKVVDAFCARKVRKMEEEYAHAARLSKPVAALAEAVRVEDTETTKRACADILGGGRIVLPMLACLWETTQDVRVREAAAIIIKSFAERFDGHIPTSVPFLARILTERKDENDVALAMAIVGVMKRHARPLVPLLREIAAKDTRQNLCRLAVETLDTLGQKTPFTVW